MWVVGTTTTATVFRIIKLNDSNTCVCVRIPKLPGNYDNVCLVVEKNQGGREKRRNKENKLRKGKENARMYI